MKFKANFSKTFKNGYKKIPANIQKKFERQFLQFSENPHHPSLNIKKIKSASGIWEGRVDRSYRFTFQIINGVYIFRNIGNHDECLKQP